MPLETYLDASDLYLARGDEVNEHRPFFTGDVLADVEIPGVQETGMAIVMAHPCSMRGLGARLEGRILTAAVMPHSPIGQRAWQSGYYDLMPLPALTGEGLYVAHFHHLGMADSQALSATARIAYLSVYGVNVLQQRLIWYLARLEVPTFQLQEAFAHTYEEADLLEEWVGTMCDAGWTAEDAAAQFDHFLRAKSDAERSLQDDLRDPQRRSAVRLACRAEARRLTLQGAP